MKHLFTSKGNSDTYSNDVSAYTCRSCKDGCSGNCSGKCNRTCSGAVRNELYSMGMSSF